MDEITDAFAHCIGVMLCLYGGLMLTVRLLFSITEKLLGKSEFLSYTAEQLRSYVVHRKEFEQWMRERKGG